MEKNYPKEPLNADYLREIFEDSGLNDKANDFGMFDPWAKQRFDSDAYKLYLGDVKNLFNDNRGSRQNSDRASSPDVMSDRAAQDIIKKVTQEVPGSGWLLGRENLPDVMNVISSVRQSRAEAAKAGQERTDRDILLEARKASDRPEGDRDESATRFYHVVDTFMGHDLNGRLPF